MLDKKSPYLEVYSDASFPAKVARPSSSGVYFLRDKKKNCQVCADNLIKQKHLASWCWRGKSWGLLMYLICLTLSKVSYSS